MSSTRELFGGAISMTLPTAYIDASDIRQVPDTQEVYISPTSDVSFIVEILARVDQSEPEAAARFHFDSIAHDNDAVSSAVSDVQVPTADTDSSPTLTPAPIILEGTQEVKKFNRPTADEVRILLALYRVQSKNVDVVFSANLPLRTEGRRISSEECNIAKEAFLVAARTFQIHDFGLFV